MFGLKQAYKLSQPLHCPAPEVGSAQRMEVSLWFSPLSSASRLSPLLLFCYLLSISVSSLTHYLPCLSQCLSSLLLALPCPHPWHNLPQRT